MSGAAPGAKIVSSRACLFVAGCSAHALFEGMIYVAKQENVDVINMSIGGLPALNDGNNARCVTYARLIEQFNVQMFISAGNNGPGVNTAGDPGVCDEGRRRRVRTSRRDVRDDYGIADDRPRQPALLLVARSARGRRLPAADRRAGRRGLDHPAVAAGRPGLPYALPPGYAHAQRHVDGGSAGDGRLLRC